MAAPEDRLIGLAVLERTGQVVGDFCGQGFASAKVVVAGEVKDADDNISEFLLDASEAGDMLRVEVPALSMAWISSAAVSVGPRTCWASAMRLVRTAWASAAALDCLDLLLIAIWYPFV